MDALTNAPAGGTGVDRTPNARHGPAAGGLRLQLVGLGDVGGTLLTGLVLLGGGLIGSVGVYDPDERRVARYEQELNSVLPVAQTVPRVCPLEQAALFCDCDAMIFTASAGVPPVGSMVKDVRMAQYEKNRGILIPYARRAFESGYAGLFFQVSDPVDLLCGAVQSAGLAPDRIIGCGLGVMRARADYCARRHGVTDFLATGRVYGPHGAGLIVANAIGDGYDDAFSRMLTSETLSANLSVRETGYKPYIAPALSSGCITILHALTGRWFDGAIAEDGLFFGRRARIVEGRIEAEPLPDNPALLLRIEETRQALRRQFAG